MVLTLKHKLAIYRRYRCDIGGYNYTDLRCKKIYLNQMKRTRFGKPFYPFLINKRNIYLLKSPYLPIFFNLGCRKRKRLKSFNKSYVYKFDRPQAYRRGLKFNKRFISIRLTRLYFINLQDHQFRQLFRIAAKLDGNFETNYLRFLEGRLIAVVYRLNLSNIFGLFKFVQTLNVFLNFKPISTLNFILPIGQLLTFSRLGHKRIAKNIVKRIKFRTLLFPTPKYLFSSYRFFFFFLLSYPKRNNLVYPFAIDLQRITGYY